MSAVKVVTRLKMNKRDSIPKVVPLSDAMDNAAREIKDNMTEMQKSQLYLKEVSQRAFRFIPVTSSLIILAVL